MNTLELLLKGIIAGLAIAAPVGPVNVLVISHTAAKGWKSGLLSGVGAATADTFYGSIAGFSITFVIYLIIKEEFWIRLIGGLLMIAIGIVYYFKRPKSLTEQRRSGAEHSDYISTFLLTLTNPTTVLSFLIVLAALGLDSGGVSWQSLFLVGGIAMGSMSWWIILVATVSHFRDRFNDRAMLWMNRIAAFAIGGFGIVTMILAHSAKR